MSALAPLQDLFDATTGDDVALPHALASLYGRLRMPRHAERPHVIGNFVTSLDGVVSLGIPGKAGGGEISGFNPHDRMVMGLLRATADAVVIGAGTLRASSPDHVWTAEYIYPPLADAYRELRAALGKPEPPLNVVVTGSGDIDLDRCLFRSAAVPSLIVTTAAGARRLREIATFRHRLGSRSPPGPLRFPRERCWTRLAAPGKASSCWSRPDRD